MTFFTQAPRDETIDKNLEMSEAELRNTIIARIKESNAWEIHKNKMHHNKDAEISTMSDEGGFSHIEKSAGKKHEDAPAINYNSSNGSFTVSCSCGKEKFVFDIKNDSVESESTHIMMKEMDLYKKNNPEAQYGREQGENDAMYDKGSAKRSDLGYNSGSQRGMKYKN